MEQQDDPQQPPAEHPPVQESEHPGVEYAGFWIRFFASFLDSIILLMVIVPLLLVFYGPGVFFVTESPGLAYDVINYVLPIVAVILFWRYRSATPGKIMMGIYIVDAKTLQQPAFGKLVLRYFGYYVSLLPLMLGFFWVGIDRRKQGFHDKIAGTLVVKKVEAAGPVEGASASAEASVSDNTRADAEVAPAVKADPWKE